MRCYSFVKRLGVFSNMFQQLWKTVRVFYSILCKWVCSSHTLDLMSVLHPDSFTYGILLCLHPLSLRWYHFGPIVPPSVGNSHRRLYWFSCTTFGVPRVSPLRSCCLMEVSRRWAKTFIWHTSYFLPRLIQSNASVGKVIKTSLEYLIEYNPELVSKL